MPPPAVTETIKRTRQPYFVLQGNICALLGAKDHLNVFIYDPIAPDPAGLINQGQGNCTARAIQIRRGEQINERALVELFRVVIANTGQAASAWCRPALRIAAGLERLPHCCVAQSPPDSGKTCSP